VVIDPGHGGNDHGTTGPSGLKEKDLVLDVAQRLGTLLSEKLGTEVTYTRTDDTFIALEERTTMANRNRADLFLSIHANSSSSPRAFGTETYYLRFTTSKEELDVAARENAGTTRSVHELQDLVRQIAEQEKGEESREFAARVQSALYSVWARSGNPARNRGLKKAPFVVLIGARMPSVLTEIGFLSNPREEAQLKKPEYRQKMAEALYKGIEQYISTLSQFKLAKTTAN
jgi:N-acetylmuramoyl-L-alanine amidase